MPEPVLSVLLVEDDRAIADLYALKLRMDGCSVSTAADSTSADLIFDQVRPRVVCVDVRLPDGGGAQLAARFVAQGATVVLLTNDQNGYERPPAGVARALLKSRTSPGQLSAEIHHLARRAAAS